MEYSHLLDQADESEDPYMQLVYACELFFSLVFYLRFFFSIWIEKSS
jgi:hypothetical protein